MNEVERRLSREALRYAVQRRISCPVSGEILDIRSAVLVEAYDGDRLATSLVVTAKVYDETVKKNVDSSTGSLGMYRVEVFDGRQLFA